MVSGLHVRAVLVLNSVRRRRVVRAASLSYDGTAAHLHSFSGTASGKDDAA